MLRAVLRTGGVACLVLVLCGADYLGNTQCELSRKIGDTNFHITVFDSKYDRVSIKVVVEKAFAAVENVINRMALDPDHPEGALDPGTMRMLKDALAFTEYSDGAFDAADGALMDLWSKAKEKAEPPSQDEIETALKISGSKNFEINAQTNQLTIKTPGLKLNIRDIVRGYAMDHAAEVLKKEGVLSAVIENENTVLCVGTAPIGRSWVLGIEHPRTVEQYAAVLEIPKETALATLGDYDDYFLCKGKRYPLVIDPRTGGVPASPMASITIISPSAALSSIAARAFFVLGSEKGFEMIERLKDQDIDAVCIEEDRPGHFNLATSENARAYLKDITL